MYSAVIVAAGKSIRFSKEAINKTHLDLLGKPVYMHSVELFLKMGFEVILVTDEKVIVDDVIVVKGGETRSISVLNGLEKVSKKYVFIHDAARPLLNREMINLLIEGLTQYDGVYLAKKVIDSIKMKTGNTYQAVDRNLYLLAETPQAFKSETIKKAFQLRNKDYSDEVSLLEAVMPNIEIKAIIHQGDNYKITYPQDLDKIKKLLADYKIGHSFDIHQLVSDRELILGGIKIDSKWGLLGHSDADVVLHAITESILGALGLGDLGSNFPDTDIKYQDISSVILLNNVISKMKCLNYGISNIDISLYLQAPKINSYRHLILKNISKLLNLDISKINFKITTTEKIGPIGKHEAIACEAVVLLRGY